MQEAQKGLKDMTALVTATVKMISCTLLACSKIP